MNKTIRIRRGLDIPLQGAAPAETAEDVKAHLYGITPDDFPGPTWKAIVKPGETVRTGSPLLRDKESGRLALVSPVSGTVKEIRRGERRKILAVVVESADGADAPGQLTTGNEADSIRTAIQESGLWAWMRQRPFDIVPDADSEPRDIFVTAFDSAPLAPALLTGIVPNEIQAGIDALAKLTKGHIYIGVPEGVHLDVKNAEVNTFSGPHPAGNVGPQIAAIRPVNKGETVWTLDIVTLAKIGHLMLTGIPDFSVNVAVTGPEAKKPKTVSTLAGAALAPILRDETAAGADVRVISGNVLTGWRVTPEDGFLRFPYRQITLIAEGDKADEFMGWASLSPKKFSVKRTFPAFFRGLDKVYPFDARVKGGHRAMILSGEYDKVFPFDIYPEYLLKAIMANDVDRMEKLGIYEVAPEDFALPEFVDTSKIELQKIVRQGLDDLRKDI